MPDYAPNYSPRLVVKYRHAGAVHRFGVRVGRGITSTPAAIVTKVRAVLATLQPALFQDWSALDGTYYPQDSFIGTPVDVADLNTIAPEQNVSLIVPSHKAAQGRWEARGNFGGRTAFVLYGLYLPNFASNLPLRDFRVTPSEASWVGDAATALNELSPAFVPPGDASAVWRSYLNVKINDYWMGRLRNGA